MMNNPIARTLPAVAVPVLPRLADLKNFILIALLTGLVMMTGLSLVYVKHHNRELFVEYNQLKHQRAQAQIEYDRLLLEQGALSTQSRVQQVAANRLGMHRVMRTQGKPIHLA